MKPRKLLYVVTEDWYFYSHRLPMVRAALGAGFEVVTVTKTTRHKELIEALGVRVIEWPMERKNLNPLNALRQIAFLREIYRREQPDIIHHIALKPILFGSIAAFWAKAPCILNAFAGLGVIFHSKTRAASILRPLLTAAFALLFRLPGTWLLFQNDDDLAKMKGFGLVPHDRYRVIRGSGIDMARYPVTAPPQTPPFICAYAGRMIESKGLPTMRQAFDILKDKAPHIQLWLCGEPDPGNPGSWSRERLTDWCRENANIYWRGHEADMAAIWPQVNLALQPSWGGEGLPKALLEAGACARPMVASDVSGCREIVVPDYNGLLVPPEDAGALASAILKLSGDRTACEEMGGNSRLLVEQNFTADIISNQTAALYGLMLDHCGK